MKRAAFAGAVTVLAVAVAAGCGGYGKSKSKSGGGEGGKSVIAGVKANNHGTKTVSGKTEIELDDYYFEPSVLTGKPGQKVTLELKNEGKVEHNFTIDSQSIDQDLEPGKDATVMVTIPKSGVVSFYCKYHKSMGMAGALAVTGASVSGTQTGTSTGTTTGGYSYGG